MTRFLVSPFDDQTGLISDSNYSYNPLLDFFALTMLQAGGGGKIAYSSNRDGHVQIYLMNTDGSGQARLTSDDGNDDNPRWSPNGAQILFQSDRDDPATGANDIYVMNSTGGAQVRLTTDANDDSAPSWSPDASKVVFQSLRNGQYYQIYSMNADGTSQINLSNSNASDTQASWSPNGAKIAFASERDHAGYSSIYVMNANGTGQQRLTFSAETVTDGQPIWSRDGAKIAFASTRDGNKEIYVMDADGTNQTRLTNDPGNDDSPSWSPDGTKIIFRSDRERDYSDPTSQVWMMNANGTSLINLSNNQVGDASPSWTASVSNQPPIADAGGSYSGITGQNTVFQGGASFDPDGQIASYAWNFGDGGGTGSGVSPTHAYAAPGNYTITLTVTDNLGAQGSATTTASVSSSSGDGFVASYLQWGLARQPSGDEGTYWADIMRAAYPQGQTSMLLAMRELGMTVFESAEYAARNRSDHWYVYDLYKTYLMRDPDPQGWAFWESNLPAMGREQLRHAFDESGEFQNIVATLTASGAPSSLVSSLATARVDPFNQTGDQLEARDCEWGVGLLSLPGRAGLDLGLGLSYSSLVWTRSGPYAYFDEDRGTPSPGFRLGFATIQGPSFDAQAGRNSYTLITSSGRRTELRQVGTSNTYEAGDSSYLQLIAGSGSLLLRSTDGMGMSFASSANGWHATVIEDRNGNFISVNYDWRGDITSITDTLGRVVTFNYDANANLSTITQSWQVGGVAQAHTWASFGWGTKALQPGFSGVAAVGTYAGESIPVLTQVGLDDGTRYNFEYTSAGQVNVIRRYTPDNIERAHTTYLYASMADDCPRVMESRVWAENWTGTGGVPAEVVTQLSDPGDGSHVMTAPDGTIYKEFYGTGWQRGLATQSEVWSDGARQKWTTTEWTQDNTAVGYQTNPRVVETNIYDSNANRRRTTVDYGTTAQYGLPHLVTEFASDGTTALRQSYTDYNLSQAYLDRRIIGLVSASHIYDPVAAQWQAKTTYAYDEAGSVQQQAGTATNHDQSFDTTLLTRGNVTSVSRWDVTDIGNAAKALTMHMGYNAAGSILSSADPLGHQNTVAYADSFSDGNNSRNTFAYPTTVTDADGYSSTVQYSFDFGAKTRVQGPPPANQPNGIIQTLSYDSAARIERVTTANNSAYTRYIYGTNYVQQFTSVNTVADESYGVQTFDGMGRVIGAASNHPGSNGGYKARLVQYDLMGRAVKQSNPAEIDSAWNPTGEDAAGWLYTQQSYDWKGRPLTTTIDGTQRSATYDGCGCAGGEVVTLTDEVGRQRKVYSDALGRQWKTEVLNPEGTVYTTTTSTLNARDQVTVGRQYQGNDQSSVSQETTMAYDGYGRLQSRHAPEQNAGSATVYSYNADDTVYSTTDARGAAAIYTYNNRHLVTGVSYSAPSGISVAPSVNFSYDAVGNRTQMTDGFGHVDYAYNTLSQLSSETRTFSDPGNASINGVTKAISYQYKLSGALQSVTDPSGGQVSYAYDQAGQLSGVTGTNYPVSQFTSGIQYRAWGAIKHLEYGNGLNLDLTYTPRGQVQQQKLAPTGVPSSGQVNRVNDYQYYDDGRVSFIADNADHNFDRSYIYNDPTGRLTQALTGYEARGQQSGALSPYKETFQYDVWGNTTDRFTRHWSYQTGMQGYRNSIQWVSTGPVIYQNNRNPNWTYDTDGRLTNGGASYTYDASGRKISESGGGNSTTESYDGDGRRLKHVAAKTTRTGQPPVSTTTTTTLYEVRSSVLGGALLQNLDTQGASTFNYIYSNGGSLIAKGTTSAMTFVNYDPVTSTEQESVANASAVTRAELDPVGADVGTTNPYDTIEEPDRDLPIGFHGSPTQANNCLIDNMSGDCRDAILLVNNGGATISFRQDPLPSASYDANGHGHLLIFGYNRGSGVGQLGHWDETSRDGGSRSEFNNETHEFEEVLMGTTASHWTVDETFFGVSFSGLFLASVRPQNPPTRAQIEGRIEEESSDIICHIQVRASKIGKASGLAYHAYIVTQSSNESFSKVFRAGPDASGEKLEVSTGVYKDENHPELDKYAPDYEEGIPPNASMTLKGSCKEINASFMRNTNRIIDANLPYKKLNSNSNSYVYTLLYRSGLPVREIQEHFQNYYSIGFIGWKVDLLEKR